MSSVCFTNDGRRIISGSWGSTIRTWDLSKSAVELPKLLCGHTASDKTVRVWSAVLDMNSERSYPAHRSGQFVCWIYGQ